MDFWRKMLVKHEVEGPLCLSWVNEVLGGLMAKTALSIGEGKENRKGKAILLRRMGLALYRAYEQVLGG